MIDGLRGQIRLACRNLARNRRRNFATGIAIALGFAALLALGGYINRVQGFLRLYTLYTNRIAHITIYKKNALDRYAIKPKDYSLTPDEQSQIQAALLTIPGVDLHGGQLTGAGLIGNGCKTLPFLATGFEPDLDRGLRQHPDVMSWEDALGQYERGRGLWEFSEERGGVALASGLARMLGKTKVSDDLPSDSPIVLVDCMAADAKEQIARDTNVQLVAGSWSGMMNAIDGEVVAHYNTGVTDTNNQAITLPLKHLQKLYDTPNVTFWSVWLKNDRQVPEVMGELDRKFKAAGLELDLYAWTDERIAPFYSGTLQFLNVMIGFLTFVLASIVVFSVFNAATMTIIERSQEIGMMRSLGYTRRGVRMLFVAEMAVLTLISVIAGGIIAVIGSWIVNQLAIELHPPGIAGVLHLKITPSLFSVSAALGLIICLALITTWFAVRMVTKRNIATLLLGVQR